MKLTTQRLKKLIREELNKIVEQDDYYTPAYSWWNNNGKENYHKWMNNPDAESAMLMQCAEETGSTEAEAKEALDNMKYDQLD